MAGNLLCRLRRHKWKLMENDKGGGHYKQCQQCGKERNVSGLPSDWNAGIKANKADYDRRWGRGGGDFGGW